MYTILHYKGPNFDSKCLLWSRDVVLNQSVHLVCIYNRFTGSELELVVYLDHTEILSDQRRLKNYWCVFSVSENLSALLKLRLCAFVTWTISELNFVSRWAPRSASMFDWRDFTLCSSSWREKTHICSSSRFPPMLKTGTGSGLTSFSLRLLSSLSISCFSSSARRLFTSASFSRSVCTLASLVSDSSRATSWSLQTRRHKPNPKKLVWGWRNTGFNQFFSLLLGW